MDFIRVRGILVSTLQTETRVWSVLFIFFVIIVKVFIKYCGKNRVEGGKASAHLSRSDNGVCCEKVKRNVTRCGDTLFTAYEMY